MEGTDPGFQDPLPLPKVQRPIDHGRDDFEIFSKYVLPNGGVCALGDMWPDAPWKVSLWAKLSYSVLGSHFMGAFFMPPY